MKNKISTIIAFACALNANAQSNQTGNPPSNNVNAQAKAAWYRGGNFPIGTNPTGANIFGTMWNSPIYTVTNGINRTRLNGNLITPIFGVNQNVSGYFGIDPNGYFSTNSPMSMLHLHSSNVPVFTTGWRRWMKTGMLVEENSDGMYVGLKTEQFTNQSDAIINWYDDAAGGGPDKLRFIFTESTPSGNGIGTNPRNGKGLNGYEYMRMQSYPSLNSTGFPVGHIGIGPLFSTSVASSPKSRIHSHTEDWFENYFQFSNENYSGIGAFDGLKVGTGGYFNNPDRSGHAYIYNQENRSILLSTNHEAPSSVHSSSTNAQNTGERVRITSIGAPTNLNNSGNAPFGVWNPGGIANQDVTRVAISHNPATPVTRPLALLHLGYNTGSILNPTTTDGWRSWMDVGTFISQGTDNMYIGLKNENGVLGDRQDAVISFGDNYTNVLPGFNIAPDKLRIIFTSPAAGQPFPGPGAMSTQNGLEFVRYVPFHNTSLGVNDPRTGFGDFESLTPVGTINPGNTIEINSIMNGYNANADTSVTGSYLGSTGASGLRFRDLTSNSNIVSDSVAKLVGIDVDKVLSVDSLGNVVLIRNGAGSGADIGNACGDSIKKPMTSNWEIPTNNFNYRFIAPAGTNPWGTNYVGIGTTCAPTANLDILSPFTLNNPNAVTAINVAQSNLGSSSTYSGIAIGVTSDVKSLNKNNIGVAATARNATYNYGVYSTANAKDSVTSNQRNVGVYAEASKAPQNFAMRGRAVSNTGSSSGLTMGGWFSAENSQTRIGVMGDINGAQFNLPTLFPNNHAIGVYGYNPSISTTDYAGYFEGKVNINGLLTVSGVPYPSDATLKTNINDISNATEILNQIEAKSFYYDTTNANGMRFSSQKQYGVIAQQIETVLPELVSNNYKPAMVDSVGTVVYAAKSYKTVNYNAFIGLLIKANQEQQAKIDSLTTKLNSKDSIQDARLAALEAAIATCCSNNSAKTANNTGSSVLNQMDVELSDKDAIVLNQNVPNPFAEQTTITYNVPSSVGKAQLLFYNSAGQIIQTVDIKTRGKGKVNVFAADLSSGMYHYTLVADGQVVDSKKMVRE